jgi:hypothetical protein
MKTQLHILTAAALMTAVLCSAQAFAAVSASAHPSTTVAAAASTAQNTQVADGYDFDPTAPDSGC